MITTAAIYLRISSDRTGEQAGVQRQREDCMALAAGRGLSVVEVCQDNDVSAAGSRKRPGFERVLELIEAGEVQVVVSWNVDRLTRNRRDTVRVIEAAQRHSVTIALVRGTDLDMTTPGGRLMADLFASIARNEVEVKSDRQKRANRQRAEAGQPHVTRRSFGYEPGGMRVRETEAAVVRDIVTKFLSGWSLHEITNWLNDEQILSTDGKRFTVKGVRDHLMSKRNAGIRVYDGEEFDAVWEPILDRDTHTRVVSEFASRAAERSIASAPRRYLLTGLLICGRCEQSMAGHRRRDHAGVYRPKYECTPTPDRARCGRNSRLAAPLEYLVRESLLYRLDSPGLTALLNAQATDPTEMTALTTEQRSLRTRLDALVDDYADGVLDRQQFSRAKQRIQIQLDEVEGRIGTTVGAERASSLLDVASPTSAWHTQTDGWRRRLLSLAVDRVVVHPSRKLPTFRAGDEIYRFDANSIEIRWRW